MFLGALNPTYHSTITIAFFTYRSGSDSTFYSPLRRSRETSTNRKIEPHEQIAKSGIVANRIKGRIDGKPRQIRTVSVSLFEPLEGCVRLTERDICRCDREHLG